MDTEEKELTEALAAALGNGIGEGLKEVMEKAKEVQERSFRNQETMIELLRDIKHELRELRYQSIK